MEGFHKKTNVYVGEVNIKVSNLEDSLKFYQQIIGLQLLEKTVNKAALPC
jgi:catechol 2,3-dioxygenase